MGQSPGFKARLPVFNLFTLIYVRRAAGEQTFDKDAGRPAVRPAVRPAGVSCFKTPFYLHAGADIRLDSFISDELDFSLQYPAISVSVPHFQIYTPG